MTKTIRKPKEVDLEYFHEFCAAVAEDANSKGHIPRHLDLRDATMVIKSVILERLPSEYVKELPMRDFADRWRCGGRFDFTRPVPWEVFKQAARAAGLDLGEGGE